MKKFLIIILIMLIIFCCKEKSVKPQIEKTGLIFLMNQPIYSLEDNWAAKIINYTDSSVFLTACGYVSFGIEEKKIIIG